MIITLALYAPVLAALILQDDPLAPLVERLRDANIEIRDNAETALVALGDAGVPALETLAASETDPDVRERLKSAIQRITSLDWHVDLDAAMTKAELEHKRLFVVSSPGPVRGPT